MITHGHIWPIMIHIIMVIFGPSGHTEIDTKIFLEDFVHVLMSMGSY